MSALEGVCMCSGWAWKEASVFAFPLTPSAFSFWERRGQGSGKNFPEGTLAQDPFSMPSILTQFLIEVTKRNSKLSVRKDNGEIATV